MRRVPVNQGSLGTPLARRSAPPPPAWALMLIWHMIWHCCKVPGKGGAVASPLATIRPHLSVHANLSGPKMLGPPFPSRVVPVAEL